MASSKRDREAALQELLEEFAVPSGEKAVRLSTGRVLRIRVPCDASEIASIQGEAQKYQQMFAGELPLPARLKKYGPKGSDPVNEAIQTLCVLCTLLVIEPELGLEQWLELSKKAGQFLLEIGNDVTDVFVGMDALTTQKAVNDEGNGSGVTPFTAPASR